MQSVLKPLDEVQHNLECALLTQMGHATEHFWPYPLGP